MDIDAVISWVDSSDPVWQEKCLRFMAAERGRGYPRSGTTATRFQDVGELARCLASIEKHAPWFRRIFILSDDQTPAFDHLRDETRRKIKIVSHADIFDSLSHLLPTFNSMSFECMLWNIEGLSEHFVYFNDDFFIARAVSERDFFDAGRIILRGMWSPMRRTMLSRLRRRILGQSARSSGFRDGQGKAAAMLNFGPDIFKFNHAPKGIVRSEMKSVFEDFREETAKTMSYRFRHPEQFMFLALYFHAAIAGNRAVIEDGSSTVDVKGTHPFKREISRLRAALRDPGVKFLCLQSLDLFSAEEIGQVLHELDRHLRPSEDRGEAVPPATGA